MRGAPPTADPEPHPGYRPGVGLMLVDGRGRIFVGARADAEAEAWQMPQGGIDPGESPQEAAWRELREEIGSDRARLVAESARWHAYDVPAERRPAYWEGRWRGQTQKWFLFRFEGTDDDIDLAAHEAEFSRWRWATPEAVLAAIVPFKRPVYEAILHEFRRVLT